MALRFAPAISTIALMGACVSISVLNSPPATAYDAAQLQQRKSAARESGGHPPEVSSPDLFRRPIVPNDRSPREGRNGLPGQARQ